MTPKVSVMMLVYNHRDYLEDALRGVLAQRADFPYELLIGEDCSTDGSRELVLDYAATYPGVIRVIGSDSNVGAVQNHLRVLRAVRGDYVAFCEGDDYWTRPDKLQKQSDFLDQNSDFGAVHTDFSRLMKIGSEWRALDRFAGKFRSPMPEGQCFDHLLVQMFIQTCTLMVRARHVRDYLDSSLPVDRYAIGDWPLCLQTAATSRIHFMGDSTAAYRLVAGSATNRGSTATLARGANAIQMVRDYCQEFEVSTTVREQAEARIVRHLVGTALLAGDDDALLEALNWFAVDGYRNLSRRDSTGARLLSRRPLARRLYRSAHGALSPARNRWLYRGPVPETL
jgi:glycosyltransferase involved in cell wall biosynthesis